MKINKKQFANIAFVVLIGLMIYPPTKVFFIRLISFPPSAISKENQQQIQDTDWQLKGLNTNNTNLNKLENNSKKELALERELRSEKAKLESEPSRMQNFPTGRKTSKQRIAEIDTSLVLPVASLSTV